MESPLVAQTEERVCVCRVLRDVSYVHACEYQGKSDLRPSGPPHNRFGIEELLET
jgi:hypothetical protein